MGKTNRPAWVEIDLGLLRKNLNIFIKDKPGNLGFISVVKDDAYGHGMLEVGRIALEYGAKYLAVSNVDEALELRENQINADIMVFGERTSSELKQCVENNLTCFINSVSAAKELNTLSLSANRKHDIHIEIDSGLSRHGVRWTKALPVIEEILSLPALNLVGIMSHFAMSDELDKTFACRQLERFNEVLAQSKEKNIQIKYKHICNTGGFLDLPKAHFDLIRTGILPLGVYPSQVCRRIHGLTPVMSVKTKVAVVRDLEAGDYVGYGMRYQAKEPRKIAVLPIGYGDGYPRVRNNGFVLIKGHEAPIVGGNAMDAMMVDITDIPEVKQWDEVVLMGKQGDAEIDVHEIARLKNTVSYDVLAGWRHRLPRVYLD